MEQRLLAPELPAGVRLQMNILDEQAEMVHEESVYDEVREEEIGLTKNENQSEETAF